MHKSKTVVFNPTLGHESVNNPEVIPGVTPTYPGINPYIPMTAQQREAIESEASRKADKQIVGVRAYKKFFAETEELAKELADKAAVLANKFSEF